MGVYTNFSRNNYYTSSDYRDVEPYHGEHFNFHELGIIATAESAANQNAFMKAIALNELASVEQYGTEEVFYESVDIGGVFDKIKAFFKKIIDKIHKIFHTFIAKMSSWFGSNKDFAKKYEKEIIKNWGLVKNDWEFKGYVFTNIPGLSTAKTRADAAKDKLKTTSGESNDGAEIQALLNAKSGDALKKVLDKIGSIKLVDADNDGKSNNDEREKFKTDMNAFRDKMDDWRDNIRGQVITAIPTGIGIVSIDPNANTGGFDSKEFTEELFKVFRNKEDSKQDLTLANLESANKVITYIKDYDKIKDALEKEERGMVKSIDDLVNAVSKAQDELIKDNRTETNKDKKLDNELIIQASALFQSCWGFIKETQTQAFSAMLQAAKDCCAQAKEVCVKIIGANKKMTEESYDYSNSYNSGNFNSFIEAVKLV